MAAVTKIPMRVGFAPGLTRARVINTGPVGRSANVGDGLNGHMQAPGTGVTHVHAPSKKDHAGRKYLALQCKRGATLVHRGASIQGVQTATRV